MCCPLSVCLSVAVRLPLIACFLSAAGQRATVYKIHYNARERFCDC